MCKTTHARLPADTHVAALPVCRFMNLRMRSMVFEDSLFEECYFEDITSSNTFFKNCTFIATLFYNTGEQAPGAGGTRLLFSDGASCQPLGSSVSRGSVCCVCP